MAGILIDELIVTLGLDASKFTAGQRAALDSYKKTQEEALKQGKALEEHGRRLNQFFSRLKLEALGAFAAFAGARDIKEFITNITTADASTGRLAERLGMSTEQLALWQNAVKLTGGSVEDATGTLQTLQTELNKVGLGMDSSILSALQPFYISWHKANGELKSASELLFELHDKIQSMPKGLATTLLANAGIGPDTISLLLRTNKEFSETISKAQALGGANRQSAAETQAVVESWNSTAQALMDMGRTLLVVLGVFNLISKALDLITGAISRLNAGIKSTLPDFLSNPTISKFLDIAAASVKSLMLGPLNLIPSVRDWAYGPSASAGTGTGAPAIASLGGSPSGTSTEAYIRKSAIAHGIDPDVAVAVAKSEGLNQYVGDRGSSFGPFQLHYGGVAGGGMAVSGMGDDFTRQTGLDARDPATVQQQIDFALAQAKRGGWGPWHGWQGSPTAGGAGTGGSAGATATTNITIQKMEVKTNDADSFSTDFRGTMQRYMQTQSANSGPSG